MDGNLARLEEASYFCNVLRFQVRQLRNLGGKHSITMGTKLTPYFVTLFASIVTALGQVNGRLRCNCRLLVFDIFPLQLGDEIGNILCQEVDLSPVGFSTPKTRVQWQLTCAVCFIKFVAQRVLENVRQLFPTISR